MNNSSLRIFFPALCFALLTIFTACAEPSEKSTNPMVHNNNLLDALNHDTLFIDFKTMGCFHWREETLKIWKTKNSFFASLQARKTGRTNELPATKQVLLTAEMIRSYTVFEKWIRSYKSTQGCTTRNDYSLNMGNEKLHVTDGSCNGQNQAYQNMISAFFGENN